MTWIVILCDKIIEIILRNYSRNMTMLMWAGTTSKHQNFNYDAKIICLLMFYNLHIFVFCSSKFVYILILLLIIVWPVLFVVWQRCHCDISSLSVDS